jgi:hypothetical protein
MSLISAGSISLDSTFNIIIFITSAVVVDSADADVNSSGGVP